MKPVDNELAELEHILNLLIEVYGYLVAKRMKLIKKLHGKNTTSRL